MGGNSLCLAMRLDLHYYTRFKIIGIIIDTMAGTDSGYMGQIRLIMLNLFCDSRNMWIDYVWL